jgi:hypothetical protein
MKDAKTIRSGAALGLVSEIAADGTVHFQKPKDASLHPRQNPHPDVEHIGREFRRVVEAAENEAIFGKSALGPRKDALADAPLRIVGLVGVRQINDLFAIGMPVFRDHPGIRDDIIHEGGAHGAGKSQIIHLNGRRPAGEYARPHHAEIAVQIDQDVDFRAADEIGDRLVRLRRNIGENVESGFEARASRFCRLAP